MTLTLAGTMGGSTRSDGSGNYIFSSLVSGGNYTVVPTKAALNPGADEINTVDVLGAQRHYLDIAFLTGCRLTAGDVNGDSTVNTIDVIAIQRFYLGLSAGIAGTGQYLFEPANRTYNNLVNSQSNQNYDALILGDVASPFTESVSDGEKGANPQFSGTIEGVALPNARVSESVGDFVVAVRVAPIDRKGQIVGFQGDFVFDQTIVSFQDAPVQKAGLTGGNWNVSGNVLPGSGPIRTLRISAYSNDFIPLEGSGTLFELRMVRIGKEGQSTPLAWAESPNGFIFIDRNLKIQTPGETASGSMILTEGCKQRAIRLSDVKR